MAFRFGAYHLIFLSVAFAILKVSVAEGECFESFERCLDKNGQKTDENKAVWCPDRCRRSGYSGGSCVRCGQPCGRNGARYMCRCFGGGLPSQSC